MQGLETCPFRQLRRLEMRGLLLPVSRESLLATGLGLLFSDRSLWALAPAVQDERAVVDIADRAVSQWRENIGRAGAHLPLEAEAEAIAQLSAGDTWRPLGGQKAGPFLQAVDLLIEYAKVVDSARPGIAAKASFHLALMGATRPANWAGRRIDAIQRGG